VPVHTRGEGGAHFLPPLAEHLPSAPPLPNASLLLLFNAFLTVESTTQVLLLRDARGRALHAAARRRVAVSPSHCVVPVSSVPHADRFV
jgi:hypothetical protein